MGKYNIYHHDGTIEEVEATKSNMEDAFKAMTNDEHSKILIGDNIYHPGSIKKIVKSDSIKDDNK